MRWRAGATFLLVLSAAVPGAAQDQPLICFGNEPSWSVDLTQRGVARFATPHTDRVEYRGSASRIDPLAERVWRGAPAAGKGGDLVVFLRDGACSDTMSDTVHPVNARVSLPGGRFLAGCCRLASANDAGSSGAGAATASGAVAVGLEGRVWRVEELAGQDASAVAAARPPLNVRFEAGRVDGFSGCNRFSGSYTLEGQRIRLSPLAGTMMACAEPATSLENAFRSVLTGTLGYDIANGLLTLRSEAGRTARLREAPPPRLEGVSWIVTGYNNGREAVVSPLGGTTLTLVFADGAVTGSAGCNSFRAPYTSEGNGIAIGPIAATRKQCAGEGVMEQEREFLAALQAAKVWTVRDDLLDMHFEGGETRALEARPK